MDKNELKEKARDLPLLPGVYIMKDRAGRVIYVGKAKQLKNRVSQYFQDSASHTPKTLAMVSQINDFDVIVADSEFEALVLECSLIKRHMPQYNILLKDGKGYPYIRLTVGEEYPRFSLSGRIEEDGARYFGPFGGRQETQAAIHAICAALRLPTCRRRFPRDVGRGRPCLNFHMGRCDAYCRPGMSAEEYRGKIDQAVALLEGKLDRVVKELRLEMELAAEELRFERAAELRDRCAAIELLEKRQKVVRGFAADTDVVGYFRGDVESCMVVLHYKGGNLIDKDTRLFRPPTEEEDAAAVSSVVKQYYLSRGMLPRLVLLPCEMEDGEPFARLLGERAGRKVEMETPQRGRKAELVRMADKNAEDETRRAVTREERASAVLDALGKMLALAGPPERIEAYDISNTGNADIVGSMVVFSGARPLKREYRRFKIKETETQDDYGSMREILRRRFLNYLEGDEKFAAAPDLLLIDGGREHAAVAVSVLEGLGLDFPVFGMVKDDRHRTRALTTAEGREIGIQANPAVFALVGTIQDETHRFAVEYHRKLHSRNGNRSGLDDIPGIGAALRNRLLTRFKSVAAISEATREELRAVLPQNAAEAVYRHYHEKESEKP